MSTPPVLLSRSSPYDEHYFSEEISKLCDELSPLLPVLDDASVKIFTTCGQAVQDAQTFRDAMKKAVDRIPSSETDARAAAFQALQTAQQALKDASKVATETAKPLLKQALATLQDMSDETCAKLQKCTVLTQATPAKLANFCSQGDAQTQILLDGLSNTALLHDMLLAGGPKDGSLGPALLIYQQIQQERDSSNNKPILQRLQLAIALEFATPLLEFKSKQTVNPLHRYQHYQQAYQQGQLDPLFDTLTVWELRNVVNSDAPNEQLLWGRQMLQNYRPDEIDIDYKWRYCYAVRTDVYYQHPDEPNGPASYPEIISGGGQCGPRAWFGRFMCRAFGIPVWGCTQPGHAAMTHWCPDGWVVCLGATWIYCFWEGRWGPDFLLETQARAQHDDFATVPALHQVATVLAEPPLDPMKSIVNPNSLWNSLALCQQQILALTTSRDEEHPAVSAQRDEAESSSCVPLEDEGFILLERTASSMLQHSRESALTIHDRNSIKIVVPATACTSPTKPSSNVLFMKSYLEGGTQLHLRDGGAVEYQVDVPELLPQTTTFMVSLRVVTVHAKMEPIVLTVLTNDDSVASVVTIPIPYTVGMWVRTPPVPIDLGPGQTTFSLTRESPAKGMALKDITLETTFATDGLYDESTWVAV